MTARHNKLQALLQQDAPTAQDVEQASTLAGDRHEGLLWTMEARCRDAHSTAAEKREAEEGAREISDAMARGDGQ